MSNSYRSSAAKPISSQAQSKESDSKDLHSNASTKNISDKSLQKGSHPESRPGSAMLGYTGRRTDQAQTKIEADEKLDLAEQHKTPIIGYSGCYAGKVKGKLGRPEVHRNVISRRDSIHLSSVGDVEVPVHSHDRERTAAYMEAQDQLKTRHVTIDPLLKDIQERLEDKYPSTAEKKMFVKKMFQNYDRNNNNTISDEDFKVCLIRLNIVLPWAELYAMLSAFDEFSDGNISYVKFLERACPKAL